MGLFIPLRNNSSGTVVMGNFVRPPHSAPFFFLLSDVILLSIFLKQLVEFV